MSSAIFLFLLKILALENLTCGRRGSQLLTICKWFVHCFLLPTAAKGPRLGEQGGAGFGAGVLEPSLLGPSRPGCYWEDRNAAWLGKYMAIDRET